MELKPRAAAVLIAGVLFGGAAFAESLIGEPIKDIGKGGGGEIIVIRDKGGPPPIHADEAGDAPEADNADDADDALDGSWADEGGITPTADHADEGGEAAESPTADEAAWAPTSGGATVADFADEVVECAGGPFLGGDCGDLRVDGSLGLGGDPLMSLDVSGAAQIGSVQVSPEGNVGVAGAATSRALTVNGVVRADDFVDLSAPAEHVSRVDPASCFTGSWTRIDYRGQYTPEGRLVSDSYGLDLICKVPVPAGAVVHEINCDSSLLEGEWVNRPWDWDYGYSVERFDMAAHSMNFRIAEGDVNFVRFEDFHLGESFGGCTFRWTR